MHFTFIYPNILINGEKLAINALLKLFRNILSKTKQLKILCRKYEYQEQRKDPKSIDIQE